MDWTHSSGEKCLEHVTAHAEPADDRGGGAHSLDGRLTQDFRSNRVAAGPGLLDELAERGHQLPALGAFVDFIHQVVGSRQSKVLEDHRGQRGPRALDRRHAA